DGCHAPGREARDGRSPTGWRPWPTTTARAKRERPPAAGPPAAAGDATGGRTQTAGPGFGLGGPPREPRPDPVPERAVAPPEGALPGHRARADERPRRRELSNELADRYGPDPLRIQAAPETP